MRPVVSEELKRTHAHTEKNLHYCTDCYVAAIGYICARSAPGKVSGQNVSGKCRRKKYYAEETIRRKVSREEMAVPVRWRSG